MTDKQKDFINNDENLTVKEAEKASAKASEKYTATFDAILKPDKAAQDTVQNQTKPFGATSFASEQPVMQNQTKPFAATPFSPEQPVTQNQTKPFAATPFAPEQPTVQNQTKTFGETSFAPEQPIVQNQTKPFTATPFSPEQPVAIKDDAYSPEFLKPQQQPQHQAAAAGGYKNESAVTDFVNNIVNGFANFPKRFAEMSNEERRKLFFRLIGFVCGIVVLSIALASFFSPIISFQPYGGFGRDLVKLAPRDFVVNFLPESVWVSGYEGLEVSFWVYKVFFTLFAILLGITAMAFLFDIFNRRRKEFSKKLCNTLLGVVVIFMLVEVLAGYNYKNLYLIMDSNLNIKSRGFAPFIFAFIFLMIRCLTGMTKAKDNIFDRGEKSIATAFALITLVIGGLAAPLYIQSGVNARITGFGLLKGAENALDFLTMTSAYRGLILLFTVTAITSFIICLILYTGKRNAFVHFNRFNTQLGLTILFIYALMGGNYMLVYFDAEGYNEALAFSMNTYSYVPLLLFACFLLTAFIVRSSTSRLNVDYKIYATAEGRLMNGRKAAAAESVKSEDSAVADPIPAFSEIDRRENEFKEAYQQKMQNLFEGLTLPKLVNHVVEYAMHSKERLSYGVIEIKTFVAGLAASRLSILQGMSGTGKTSLPRVFMESIDGLNEVIAVESSWRDKNELLGYYNEFNKKFTPKEFTQALYKATFNQDVPVFIVLDELNLSRIEYYFSDFLSLMEARENERFIKLFDVQLYPDIDERLEYLHLRGGHTLDIPPNVWFVGTANRDESTFEISDKVYDRAQTLNFDKRAPKINETQEIHYPKRFVTYSMLRELFDNAKSMEFNAEYYQPLREAERALIPYKISFGNRILKQIEDFVKVYVACSTVKRSLDRDKYIAEAVDCIVLSKIVRKLEFKQISDVDTLIEEFSELNMPKCHEFLMSLQHNEQV